MPAARRWRATQACVRHRLTALALICMVTLLPRWWRKLRAQPMLDVDTLKQQSERGEHVLVRTIRSGASSNSGSKSAFTQKDDR